MLEISKVAIDVSLAVFLAIYLPYIAIVCIAMHLLSFCRNYRQETLATFPVFWLSGLFLFNFVELAILPTYLGIRSISNELVAAVREKVCS